MRVKSFIQSCAKRFSRDTEGSVALLFGLAAIPVAIGVGIAVDMSQNLEARTELQSALDASALAAAASADLSDGERESLARTAFEMNYKPAHGVDFRPSFRLQNDAVVMSASFDLPTSFMRIAGFNTVNINSDVSVNLPSASQRAMSMYLVADQSGSMNSQGRMPALKQAVKAMSNDFRQLDPGQRFIRMGAVSYSTGPRASVNMEWGSQKADALVQGLTAGGGTDSSASVRIAREELNRFDEEVAHKQRNAGQNPLRIMVFLTDGNNNQMTADAESRRQCDLAKNDGVEIYTIAFQAPQRGRQLLQYCADTNDHYFEPGNANELIEVFKEIGAKTAGDIALSK